MKCQHLYSYLHFLDSIFSKYYFRSLKLFLYKKKDLNINVRPYEGLINIKNLLNTYSCFFKNTHAAFCILYVSYHCKTATVSYIHRQLYYPVINIVFYQRLRTCSDTAVSIKNKTAFPVSQRDSSLLSYHMRFFIIRMYIVIISAGFTSLSDTRSYSAASFLPS